MIKDCEILRTFENQKYVIGNSHIARTNPTQIVHNAMRILYPKIIFMIPNNQQHKGRYFPHTSEYLILQLMKRKVNLTILKEDVYRRRELPVMGCKFFIQTQSHFRTLSYTALQRGVKHSGSGVSHCVLDGKFS